MNAFYTVVEFIRQRLQNNPNVNTVIFGRTEDRDLYKKNIYPIAHIIPQDAQFSTPQVSLFSFGIAVMDQRDLSKRTKFDKFEGNDDLQDNLNITYVIINDLINYLKLQNNDYLIELESSSSASPVIFQDHNLLDGWVVNVTLKIPNNQSVC